MLKVFNINSLEFDILLERLSDYCFTEGGKSILYSLQPLEGIDQIRNSYRLFDEGIQFYAKHGHSLCFDMPESLQFTKRISHESLLEAEEFLGILTVIRTSQKLKKALKKAGGEKAGLLGRYFDEINDLSILEESINRVFDETGQVRDNASKLLKKLKSEKASVETEIREKLKRFLNEPLNRDIIQDGFITARNDRFVIPVKSNFFKLCRGIVQDKSSSGITFFVEPDFIVSNNNRKREIEAEEKNEILRILRVLSKEVKEESEKILKNIDIIHFLDFIFGITAVSIKYNYFTPQITSDPVLSLKAGRHPLLLFIKGYDHTVPVNIDIKEGNKIVVITGPNTGGKTVCLKTVGLLILMANCGIPVPAGSESEIPVLDHIMCDIGDEQNIAQNLSTFSSHISKISKFLEHANDRSIILIDEIGAGTDPKEGSALGIAILEYLRSRGAIVIATTHYGTIKAFSHMRDGYMTSMVEFDKDTLKPTFRLITGEVGTSNAIYIAGRIGIKPEVIELANRYIGDRERDLERLLNSIERKNKILQMKLRDIEKEKEEFKVHLSKHKSLLRDKVQVMIELEKRRLDEIEELLGSLRLQQTKRKKSRSGKRPEQETVKHLESHTDLEKIEKRVSRMKADMEKKLEDLPVDEDGKEELQNREPSLGCFVKIKNLSGRFLVKGMDKKTGDYEIALNNLRMKVKRSDIEKVEDRESGDRCGNSPGYESYLTHFDNRSVALEINIMGMDVDSAIKSIEPVIDDAFSAGRSYIRIIHGVGEGILKEAVRDYLRTRHEVKEIVKGENAYKNSGITEVQFY